MTSGARFDATETCAGTFSTKLSDAYLTQPFYMNYETKFGGKEQYNDIIAQFNILQEKAYPSVENELGNAAAELEMAAYAAAAVDTMEVMEQPLYEIFDRLRQILKQAVAAMNTKSLDTFAKEAQEAGLFYAYAVLKGCRMKALITEKYEKAALDILEAAEAKAQGEHLLVVSENGMGKRTLISEFNAQIRGGKGVLCYKVTEKTGYLIGAKLVNDGREIMLITTEGIVIRMSVDDISVIGRNTSGVKLMNIDQESDIKVASIAKVRESATRDNEAEEEELEEAEDNTAETEENDTEE